MSNPRQQPLTVPTPPVGDEIARYDTYLEAQQAVDYLSDQKFAVDHLTIVGTDLRMVERVTGRLTYGRVALAGAMSGMWFGLFVGLLLSLFGGTGVYGGIMFVSILLGGGMGLLMGVLTHAMNRGRRDFASQSQIVATQYAVWCQRDVAGQAQRILASRAPGAGGGAGGGRSGQGGSGGQAGQGGAGSASSSGPTTNPSVPYPTQHSGAQGKGTPAPGTSGAGALSGGKPGAVVTPTVPPAVPPAVPPGATGPAAEAAAGAATANNGATGSTEAEAAIPAPKVDSRWTLPDGTPRYGAMQPAEDAENKADSEG
ncbi:MAG: hypothetical protein LBH13_05235 [Cellulomonadaceae bacterium]|jgi:hypothetical protein|nr:hypothetical protein [Cellulomonadaceae bacterium]